MKSLFTILFLIIIKFSGVSQPTEFNTTFLIGTNPIFHKLIEFHGSYYIMGQSYNPNKKFLFSKIDKTGTLQNYIYYGDSTTGYYLNFDFARNNNNTFIAVGAFEKIYSGFTYTAYPIIIKIDSTFNIVHDTLLLYDNLSFTEISFLGSNIVLGGTTPYYNNWDTLPHSPGNLTFNLLFWKTDSLFNYLNHNSIGISNIHENFFSLSSGFDNNFLMGGVTRAFTNKDWYLVNVDTNGQVLGQYYYGNPTLDDLDGITEITLGSDSSYYLAGIFNKFYDSQSSFYYVAPQVVKLDRQFNTVWSKQFGPTTPGISVMNIISTTDNNQAILTQRSPIALLSTFYSQVTKFNNDGNILWSRNYYDGDTTQLIRYKTWDLIETSDKGFAMCGSAIDTINVGPNQEAWLVKTDSLGCDGLRSCNDTALVCQILQAPDTACKNDTAWLHVKFKGRSAPYYIYANTVLALDSVYYPYTLPLWIDTLVPYIPTTLGMQQVIIKVNDPWGWNNSDTVQIFVKNCGTGSIAETWYPKKVEIYPNPATNELHVKIRTTITTPVTITIYNMQGKAVKQINTKQSENVINISGLEQGVYSVMVSGNGLICNERFVKIE